MENEDKLETIKKLKMEHNAQVKAKVPTKANAKSADTSDSKILKLTSKIKTGAAMPRSRRARCALGRLGCGAGVFPRRAGRW